MANKLSLLHKCWLALRALVGLARARLMLRSVKPGDIVARNERARRLARVVTVQTDRIARVRWAISRVANIVPWRSDCLVQALAGQDWLIGEGIAAEITIGAKRENSEAINAHAWLSVGETVVLGGEIDAFQPLLAPDNQI